MIDSTIITEIYNEHEIEARYTIQRRRDTLGVHVQRGQALDGFDAPAPRTVKAEEVSLWVQLKELARTHPDTALLVCQSIVKEIQRRRAA